MIDEERRQAIKTGARTPDPAINKDSLKGLSPVELLSLRFEISQLLPQQSLQGLNLETELVEQYTRVKQLQETVLNDDDVPANQRAQVANSVAQTLQHLIKMQTEFHTSERFKAIENLMIRYMKKLPREVAEQFLDDYAALS